MSEKRFTDIWCSETGHIGVTDYGTDKEFTSSEFEDFLNELNEENEHYKSIFFELVETALTDKHCRELYCKGILDIFDEANSLNQARDMIKEFLE